MNRRKFFRIFFQTSMAVSSFPKLYKYLNSTEKSSSGANPIDVLMTVFRDCGIKDKYIDKESFDFWKGFCEEKAIKIYKGEIFGGKDVTVFEVIANLCKKAKTVLWWEGKIQKLILK